MFEDIESSKNKFEYRTDHTTEELEAAFKKSHEMSMKSYRDYDKHIQSMINKLKQNKEK